MRAPLLLAVALSGAVGCKSFEKVDEDPGSGGSSGTGGSGGGQNCNHQITFADDFQRGAGQFEMGSSDVPGELWVEDAGDWLISDGDLVLTGDLSSRASSPHNPTGYRARLSFKATLSNEPNDEVRAGFLATAGAETGVYAAISRVADRTGIYEGPNQIEAGESGFMLPATELFVELEVSEAQAVMQITQSDYAVNGGSEYLTLETSALTQSESGDRFFVSMDWTSVLISEVKLEAAEPCP